MSSITPITSQLNNVGGCNSNNCCDQIAALTSRISTLEGKVEAAHSTAKTADGKADDALGKIIASSAAIGVLGTQFGGLSAEIAAVTATVAALGARIAAVAATIAALGARIAAVAATVAAFAGEVAAATVGIAAILAELAPIIIAVAAIAGIAILANQALTAGNSANSKADKALAASTESDRLARGALDHATEAIQLATAATSTGNRAIGTAENAEARAKLAYGEAVNAAAESRNAANAANHAEATAGALKGELSEAKSIATGASATADRAVAAAAAASSGRDGLPGLDGKPGRDGAPGKDGEPGKNGISADPTLPARVKALESKTGDNTVNAGKEDEIIKLLQGTRSDVLAMPAVLAGSQVFRAAATSAAAAGSCQSSQPGGCNGGLPDQLNTLRGSILSGINGLSNILNGLAINTLGASLGAIQSTVNLIHKSVGTPLVGTLSTWAAATSEVVNRSQILNIITWIGVLHNAYFLSNSLTQTLFSAVSNSLAALGLKDTSTNPEGTPFNVGEIVSKWTDGYFKSIFGVATVEGIKSDWKKYSRIYQAAAQVMYSIQSIGQSILGALEVVGSHVGKIGNGLRKFQVVGEKAYNWMNPRPGFQNRFFTGLQGAQEFVSGIDQVASTVLSTQESITQLGKNKDDLYKSLSQNSEGKDGASIPAPEKVEAADTASFLVSIPPTIPDSALTKP